MSIDTISVSTQAVMMAFPEDGKDVKVIHCPDIPLGTEVEVQVEGMEPVTAKVKDFSDRFDADIYLAMPPNFFPEVDVNDDEAIAGMIAHGVTAQTKVVVTDLPDKDKQLMIDFYMSGKTEQNLNAR